MEYRQIGRTDMKASVVGFGGEHLENTPYEVVEGVIHEALDQGMNIIDVFMPGEDIRTKIGKSIRDRRDKVLIQGHIGSIEKDGQYDRSRDPDLCRRYFEDMLRTMGTDYIDLGMMFFIDTEEDYRGVFETGFVEYVQKLKRDGTIRAIGFSSHNPKMAARVVETGVPEMMMFSINLAFDMMPARQDVLDIFRTPEWGNTLGQIDPDRQRLYELCESRGVGITVMKTLGSSLLLSAEQTPFDAPLSVGQCIHYALTRPAVVSALIGCRSRQEVLEAVKYCSLSDDERDYTAAVGSFRDSFSGKCVYCNHCLPCPSGIDIAGVNKYLDIAALTPQAIPPTVDAHYRALGNTASACIRCGACEGRCPFGVPVIERMERASGLFGE